MMTVGMNYETEIERILNNGLVEPEVLIVGVGGAGCNIASYLSNNGVRGKFVAINTDEKSLVKLEADMKLLIGKDITFGSAAGYPEVAEKCTELGRSELEAALYGADLVFLITGLGGGTGHGTAPLVAEMARDHGSTVVTIAVIPFGCEDRADTTEAMLKLKLASNSLIPLDNNRLMDMDPDMKFTDALKLMNRLVLKTVKETTQIVDRSLLDAVMADAQMIMAEVNSLPYEAASPGYVSQSSMHALAASRFGNDEFGMMAGPRGPPAGMPPPSFPGPPGMPYN